MPLANPASIEGLHGQSSTSVSPSTASSFQHASCTRHDAPVVGTQHRAHRSECGGGFRCRRHWSRVTDEERRAGDDATLALLGLEHGPKLVAEADAPPTLRHSIWQMVAMGDARDGGVGVGERDSCCRYLRRDGHTCVGTPCLLPSIAVTRPPDCGHRHGFQRPRSGSCAARAADRPDRTAWGHGRLPPRPSPVADRADRR
jgi:hypothetical protein